MIPSLQDERDWGITQDPWGLATNEIAQAEETGRDVRSLRERLAPLQPSDEIELRRLYEEALALPPPDAWRYDEPSALEAIVAALPEPGQSRPIAPEALRDRLSGAWHGRIAGNMVGRPIEGTDTSRAELARYLHSQGAYPLRDFLPVAEPVPERIFGIWGVADATLGRVHGSSRDDDIDFTVLGLHLLETYGADYTTQDVGVEWRRRLPILQTYTAERAVYANLVRGVPLETAAEVENPFREWIGALIRADIFAYAAAGDPRRAALLAYADAALSHRGNGIYGALWAAALIASAFTANSPEMCVVESLRHVPPRSRLAAEVMTMLDDYRAGLEWEVCLERLEARHPDMHETHVLNNAGALTAAVLHGDGDFAATIGLAVQAKLDTDSIGATAGSWAGAFGGYDAMPKRLVDPLEDLARTAVFGVGDVRISELVERTLALHDCFD